LPLNVVLYLQMQRTTVERSGHYEARRDLVPYKKSLNFTEEPLRGETGLTPGLE